MLRPIPAKILKHTVIFHLPTGVDQYQNPTYADPITVERVAVQPTDKTRKAKDNTDVSLSSIVFIDARNSSPVDVQGLKDSAESVGHSLEMEFEGRRYTVMSVDKLYDDSSIFHHWEVGVV